MLYLIKHTDPGHGWLQVPLMLIRTTGIKVTGYSYFSEKTQNVFLEEDCDAPKFIRYLTENKIEHAIKDSYEENSFVRKLTAPLPEEILA